MYLSVQAIRMSSPPSRAEVVADHGGLVWSLCKRLDPQPEDAYQEVWEKVFRGLDRFDPEGRASLRTWVATITHRHLVDRHRRRKVRGEVVALEDRAVLPRIEGQLDEHRRKTRLEAALKRLPEGQRRVVVAHHVHGLELTQIAESEGVAVGTVKSRLHRGRARLAQLMGGAR